MSESVKKALLDTDFLFKTQLAQNNKREPLANLIMQFEGYDFFCHEKIISELQTHGFSPDPIPWIEKQVELGKGHVVVFKNNRPKLLVIDLDKEPQIEMSEDEKLEFVAKRILREHPAAFEELAK